MVDFDPTYGQIDIRIRNFTQRPVTIIWGKLDILNIQGDTISEHQVTGLGSIKGSDFGTIFASNDEKILPLFIDFSSTHCIILNLDDDGTADDRFTLQLTLEDLNGNKYTTLEDDCFIKARGSVLHLIKLKYKNMRTYLKSNFKILTKAIRLNNYKTIEYIMKSPNIDFKLVKADHILNIEAFPETHYIFECVKLAVDINDEKLLNYLRKIGVDEKIILKAQGKHVDTELPIKEFPLWDDIRKREQDNFLESRRFDD